MSLYRHSDDVVYTWQIEPFEHIAKDCLLSPQYQFTDLSDGFWQVVLYPRKKVNTEEYVQLGLTMTPVHDGPKTIVRFRFEIEARGRPLDTLFGLPRLGEYPKDNGVCYNVIRRDSLFEGIRSVDPIKVVIKCYIKNLRREKHFRILSLKASSDIKAQQANKVLEVNRNSEHIEKDIVVGEVRRRGDTEALPITVIIKVTTESDQDWFKIALVSRIPSPTAINCSVSLLDTKGQVYQKTEKQNYFFRKDAEWELPQPVKKSELDDTSNNLLDSQGNFTLRFDMQISTGEFVHSQEGNPTCRPHLPGCALTLTEELEKGFESGKYSDLTLTVDKRHATPDSEPIKVHKCILASRSPYFKTMLDTNWKEKNSSQICISGVDYSTLRTVIRFLYSDFVHFVGETGDWHYREVMEVYRVADMFMVYDLREDCSLFLQSHLSDVEDETNFKELRKYFEKYSDEKLSKAIDEFGSRTNWELVRTSKESSTEPKKSPAEPQEPVRRSQINRGGPSNIKS